MSAPGKNGGFNVNNEIVNAASGDNNRHAVNSNFGCTLVTSENGQIFIHGAQVVVQSHTSSVHGFIGPSTSRSIAAPIKTSFVSRSAWGAKPPTFQMENLKKPVGMVIIGHTVTQNDENSFAVEQQCRTMQNHHFKELGDIAYNFLIGCDGKVYEGRGFNIVGAHTRTYNAKSLGIAFIGDFRLQSPPSASIEVCKALLEMGVAAGHIAPNYEVVGQCDVQANESPGRLLHRELHRLRH